LLAGARRFNCRVEREDIGLKGYTIDDANDVDDFLRCRVDRPHGLNDFLNYLPALQRDRGCRLHQYVSLAGIFSVLAHG